LSHVRSCMSVQTTQALLCLNSWYKNGLVENGDVLAVAREDDVRGKEPPLMPGWDHIRSCKRL
ncbi:hypothetical protein K525DRAFT_204563, partial [Schizophyllum commune Loenen D]